MRTSRDVVFNESHPFYPCPTSDASPASLVDHLSFLLFPDAPPASLPIPHSTLPTSMSSSESSPVVPDYTMKPLVTQVYNRCGARLSDAPTSSAVLGTELSLSSRGRMSLGVGEIFWFISHTLGLLLEQLGQHLGLFLEQLGQQHLGCFVRTAAS
jgi:hypothetical protein